MESKSTRLAALLNDRNMSVAALAKWVGCPRSTAAKWVYYGVVPDPKYLEKIYLLTEGVITPNDFYNFSAITPPPPENPSQLQRVNGNHLEDDLPLADAPVPKPARRR